MGNGLIPLRFKIVLIEKIKKKKEKKINNKNIK